MIPFNLTWIQVSKITILLTSKDILKNKKTIQARTFQITGCEKISENRNYYFENVFRGDTSKSIYSPINFKRLLENATNNFESVEKKSDLHPIYVLDTFDKLENELIITEHYKSNEVIIMLMRLYLSPNLLVTKHKLNKLAFDRIISTVTEMFYSSITHACCLQEQLLLSLSMSHLLR